MRELSLRTRTKKTPEGMKLCGHCCEEKPANEDHFDKDSSKPDGFRNWCKQCRKQKHNLKRLENAAKIIDVLDAQLLDTLTKSKPGGSNVPHQAEIYEALMSMMGGANGYAQHFMATFVAAKPGSQTRERMLANVQKLSTALSDTNKVSMPTELMSDADLEAEWARRQRPAVINGEAVEHKPEDLDDDDEE